MKILNGKDSTIPSLVTGEGQVFKYIEHSCWLVVDVRTCATSLQNAVDKIYKLKLKIQFRKPIKVRDMPGDGSVRVE